MKKYSCCPSYAVIAVKLLQSGAQADVPELWEQVRRTFKENVGIEPARSEQGEVKLVEALFEEKELT